MSHLSSDVSITKIIFDFFSRYCSLLICKLFVQVLQYQTAVVSQSSPLKRRTLALLVCRPISRKSWSVWLRFLPSGDVQVLSWIFLRCRDFVLLNTGYCNMTKFTYLIPLSFQMIHNFALKSHNKKWSTISESICNNDTGSAHYT